MTHKTVGVYLENFDQLDLIDTIKLFLEKTYDIVHIHMFGDGALTSYTNLAYLSTFYMYFFKQALLFMNIEDFLIHKDSLVSSDIYIITTIEDIKINHIPKQDLKNIKLLTINNGEINEI